MKSTVFFVSCLLLSTLTVFAQGGGNALFSGNRNRSSGVLTGSPGIVDPKDTTPGSFLEANVMLNAKADEYRAIFALAQEGASLGIANEKITTQITGFLQELERLKVPSTNIFVDFVNQNRIYDYAVNGDTAQEKLSGFEVKKNVIVRFQNYEMLDKLLAAAAKLSIYDLVKVDYVITDMTPLRDRLMAEASKIIRKKETAYTRQFGIKMRPTSVYQEKYNAFFPTAMYSAYVAYESNEPTRYNQRVIPQRKTSTFYYAPLDPSEFDAIINPAGLDPNIQITLYLRIKYSR